MTKKKFAYLILIASILFSVYFIYDTFKLVNNKTSYNYNERKEELVETDARKLKMEISDYNYSVDITSLFLDASNTDSSVSYLYAFKSQNESCDNINDNTNKDLLKMDGLIFKIELKKVEENKFEIKNVQTVVKDPLDSKFLISSIPNIKNIVELSLEDEEDIISLNLQWDKRYIIGKLPYQVCK